MQNPGRRDGDDARPDPTESGLPQAGSAGAPADDGALGVPAPDDMHELPPYLLSHALML